MRLYRHGMRTMRHATFLWCYTEGTEVILTLPPSFPSISQLGLVLGLSYHRLKGMKDSETFLEDMIEAWLQKVDQVQKRGVPMWQRLVEALRHDRVGQAGIASEIETEKLHNT